MTQNKIIETTLRIILLTLFSIKFVFVILSQIDLVLHMYSVKYLINNPIFILKLNLLIEPLIILLGIIGIFIRRRLGFILMLLLPSLILAYELIPFLTKYHNFESAWHSILLSLIFYFIINSNYIRINYKSGTIKQTLYVNIKAIMMGIIISLFMYYFNGRLG